MPTCTIKFFAQARDAIGKSEISYHYTTGHRVSDLRKSLAEKHPQIDPLIRHCSFAIDHEYASDEAILHDGAEVACIPPVSGG